MSSEKGLEIWVDNENRTLSRLDCEQWSVEGTSMVVTLQLPKTLKDTSSETQTGNCISSGLDNLRVGLQSLRNKCLRLVKAFFGIRCQFGTFKANNGDPFGRSEPSYFWAAPILTLTHSVARRHQRCGSWSTEKTPCCRQILSLLLLILQLSNQPVRHGGN